MCVGEFETQYRNPKGEPNGLKLLQVHWREDGGLVPPLWLSRVGRCRTTTGVVEGADGGEAEDLRHEQARAARLRLAAIADAKLTDMLGTALGIRRDAYRVEGLSSKEQSVYYQVLAKWSVETQNLGA